MTTYPYEPPRREYADTRHENGGYSIADVFALRDHDWRSGVGVELTRPDPGWYIDVAGKNVLYASEHETRWPMPPAPKVPLWTRMRRALREQVRANAGWIAGKLGYHRDNECGGWDE